MNKKLTTLISAVFLTLAVVIMPTKAPAKATYKVTFGHVEPVNSGIHATALKIKELVEQRTNGDVSIMIHPTSELGPGPDQGQMTQTGAIQMAILPESHIAGIFPEAQIFSIPFLFPGSLEKAAEVMNGDGGRKLFSYLDKKDLIGLAIYPQAYKQFTSNKAIHTPDDFKGQKIRTMASPLVVESYKLLGASPTPISYHEVYTALQMGTVDGEENPFWAIGEMKFYEVQKYIVESNHAPFVSLFIANKQWYEKLPEKYRNIIREVAQEVVPSQVKLELEHDNKWKEKFAKEKRVNLTKLTPESREAFRHKLSPLSDVYVKLVGPHGAEILNAYSNDSPK